MYDYEYEDDVLMVLRLMKYLHQQDPQELEMLLNWYKTFNSDTFYECAESVIWSIFDDTQVEDDDEITIETFRHPALKRFYHLGRQWCVSLGCNANVWRRTVQDVVQYFLVGGSYSVWNLKYAFSPENVEIKVWLSPDSYEPIPFGNSLVDLLRYLQRENERLAALLSDQELEERKEAA